MCRKTHLVGAWPGLSEAHAMERALREVGPHLERLSDGETGLRSQWIVPTVELFRAHPDVDLIKDGAYTGYEDTPTFRVQPGKRLTADTIDLGYFAAFSRSYPQFKVLRDRFEAPSVSFQVGIPNIPDLCFECFEYGEEDGGYPVVASAFAEATVREIERIREVAGDDVVFQLETSAPLAWVAEASAGESQRVAGEIADELVELVKRTPPGTRYGAHLCLGDLNHESFATMTDVRPWVLLANAIAERWPDGYPLEHVHAPFAAASEPPPSDEAFYAPLADLRLPEETRFVAGFIHEDVDVDHLRTILDRIEGLYGREVDVAAACGLGRRPDPEEAWDAMAKARELIEAP